ncbi:MAG: hypothetical protein L6R40_008164 [Gallowayella cf. fulva]|nr:MAG: hypothetical protein L6R40_008164 [Xanthomendoza cf. fulva]
MQQRGPENNTITLTRPLHPQNPRAGDSVEQTITLSTGIAPQGIELVASLATRIYSDWRNVVDLRILGKTIARGPPYRDFEFITQPKIQAGAVLTPEKVGIVRCRMLNRALDAESWPGVIRAVVFAPPPSDTSTRALHIGTLTVINSPDNKGTAVITSSGVGNRSETESSAAETTLPITTTGSSTASSLSLPNRLEKRWLICWSGLFFYALGSPPHGFVTDALPPGPGPVTTFKINCGGPATSPDFFDVDIYARAWRRMTWEKFVAALLSWLPVVADQPYAMTMLRVVRDGTVQVASLRVVLHEGEEGSAA